MSNSTLAKEKVFTFQPEIFEEAREAVITLKNLRKYLTPSELETLEILLDKKIVRQLSKSLKEAEKGKLKPFESILK
jgi:vacuolar-type H+-ATPase subunit C/Vma6